MDSSIGVAQPHPESPESQASIKSADAKAFAKSCGLSVEADRSGAEPPKVKINGYNSPPNPRDGRGPTDMPARSRSSLLLSPSHQDYNPAPQPVPGADGESHCCNPIDLQFNPPPSDLDAIS